MEVEWIGVDWGSSHVRAFAMNGQSIVQVARSGDGMATLSPGAFEPALLKLIGPWLRERPVGTAPIDLLACGMVGARQGWLEAPYAATPIAPLEAPLTFVPTEQEGVRVHLIAGLKQLDPPDVMRGEETQIAGFLDRYPDYDGGLCLPGTHCKWARLRNGQVEHFQSYMTGEMFDLLSRQSLLRHSMRAEGTADGTAVGAPEGAAKGPPEGVAAEVAEGAAAEHQAIGWDEAAFLAGFRSAHQAPASFASALFRLRAVDILLGSSKSAARSKLSGLLVGLELASACPQFDGSPIAVIGSKAAALPYLTGLESLGIAADYFDGEEMTLRGLSAARQRLLRTPLLRTP